MRRTVLLPMQLSHVTRYEGGYLGAQPIHDSLALPGIYNSQRLGASAGAKKFDRLSKLGHLFRGERGDLLRSGLQISPAGGEGTELVEVPR